MSLTYMISFVHCTDRKTIERLERFAHGTYSRQAKYATRVLAFHEKKDELCLDLVEVRESPEIELNKGLTSCAVHRKRCQELR